MAPLSIASLNTRGLNDPVKCSSAFTFLLSEGNDISLLQDCNLFFRENYKVFEDRWRHGPSVWSGDNKNRSSGVAVLFKGQDFIIQRVQRVIDGRILCVDVSWFGNKFRVISVYCTLELQERLAVFKELQPLLLCSREVILGGDYNCLVSRKDKLTTPTVRLDSSSEILQNIIKDFRLKDAYRSKNPILAAVTACMVCHL